MSDQRPTEADLRRDLDSDLELVKRGDRNEYTDCSPQPALCWRELARRDMWDGWPAAIRRALAAEAEVARLRNELATTDEDNRILRDKLQSAAEKIATMSAHLSRLAERRTRNEVTT